MSIAALAVLAACGPSEQKTAALPALGADLAQTSVSGISSGAYMAGQFQMAHASIVKGAAIIAGGPYGCAQSVFADNMPLPGSEFMNLSKAINGCMLSNLAMWGAADPKSLADKAKQRAEKGEIEPIKDVLGDRIYLFTGTSDRTVVPDIVKAAAQFYIDLGVPPANIKLVSDLPAGHAFVTRAEGQSCGTTGDPYVVHCDYDQAGELLKHIYGPLQNPAERETGQWLDFDQTPFTRDLDLDGLASTGSVYIPKTCRDEPGCRVHIAFHGCAQNRQKVGDTFIRTTGFARWADTNRLIVLYPQTKTMPFNPQACWDWWGYTGTAYLTSKAPQTLAVYRMLQALEKR